MLSLGAYGMLRFPVTLLGRHADGTIQILLLLIGLLSQWYGGVLSLAATDIKRLVAYSSVSQMGYVLFAVATLTPLGMAGAIFHIIGHGLLKATMFMAVGLVIKGTGHRNLADLGGLRSAMPWASLALLVGALGMAGMPPLVGFHSEWMMLGGGLASAYPWLGIAAFVSPLLTAGYGLRLVARVALGTKPDGLTVQAVPRSMRWSTMAMSCLALITGVLPGVLYGWAQDAAAVLNLGGAL